MILFDLIALFNAFIVSIYFPIYVCVCVLKILFFELKTLIEFKIYLDEIFVEYIINRSIRERREKDREINIEIYILLLFVLFILFAK